MNGRQSPAGGTLVLLGKRPPSGREPSGHEGLGRGVGYRTSPAQVEHRLPVDATGTRPSRRVTTPSQNRDPPGVVNVLPVVGPEVLLSGAARTATLRSRRT